MVWGETYQVYHDTRGRRGGKGQVAQGLGAPMCQVGNLNSVTHAWSAVDQFVFLKLFII